MATVQRYVNTASSGGDGTTNNTSGATAAYASQSSAEANMGGSATDDYILDCCGTAADTTAVTWDFAVNLTTGTLLIRGNHSDGAGFYTGNAVISSSHYRLDVGNVANALTIAEANTTVDGIQATIAHSGSNGSCFRTSSTPTFRNCRALNTGSTDFGFGNNGTTVSSSGTRVYENNLVVGFDVAGIDVAVTNNFAPTCNIYQNTCYGDGASSIGVRLVKSGVGGSPTFNVKGNALANSGSSSDIDASAVASGTVNYADNATEDFNLGTTNEIDLGNPTDAWTSPGTSASSDFSVKNASSALYSAVNPTLVTLDITGFTRNGTNHDVGCFELQGGGFQAAWARKANVMLQLGVPQ